MSKAKISATQRATVTLGRVLNNTSQDERAALRYFRARILGITTDGYADKNYADTDGVHLSYEELATLFKERGLPEPSNGLMALVAIHETIHYDMRHPWQKGLVQKILRRRYNDDPAPVLARLNVMDALIEWQTNRHMMHHKRAFMDDGKPHSITVQELDAVQEVATFYERASKDIKQVVGPDWENRSPMQLALTLKDDDIKDITDALEQQMEALSEMAKALQGATGGDIRDNGSPSDDEGDSDKGKGGSAAPKPGDGPITHMPTQDELEQGTMTDAERMLHELNVGQAAESTKYAGGHVEGSIAYAAKAFEVKVDPAAIFQEHLRAEMGSDRKTWARPHRAYRRQGVYIPSSYSLSMRELGVIVDTSGSMSKKELSYACGVLYKCAKALSRTAIKVYSVDTCIRKSEEIHSIHDLEGAVELSGGGGTNFGPALRELREEAPSVVAIITDGFVDVQAETDPGCAVFWFLTIHNYEDFDPPFGRVVPAVNYSELD